MMEGLVNNELEKIWFCLWQHQDMSGGNRGTLKKLRQVKISFRGPPRTKQEY
jgi:hypothetical protein